MKKLLAAVLAFALIASLSVFASAATPSITESSDYHADLGYGTGNTNYKNSFFANGKSVVVDYDGTNTTVTVGGTTYIVPSGLDLNIYGGANGKDGAVNVSSTSITIKNCAAGDINKVVGGNLLDGTVGSTSVVMEGGTVKSLFGGSLAGAGTPAGGYTLENAVNGTTPAKVNNASITINGGTATTIVYGGGNGYSYTGNSTVTINGGSASGWVAGGGANGYTAKATVTVNDGSVNYLQAAIRGQVNTATINVKGGEVSNLYACSCETSDDGAIVNNTTVGIYGGTVGSFDAGYNGGKDFETEGVASTTMKIYYSDDVDESLIEQINNAVETVSAATGSAATAAKRNPSSGDNEPSSSVVERDRIVEALGSAKDGETVTADAKKLDNVSRFIADAMSGRNVNLSYELDGETVTVNGFNVPLSPAWRIWYSFEAFAEFA